MPTLKIDRFRGLLPKADPRNLPHGFASTAENVRFDAGDLSPIREVSESEVLPGDLGNLYYLQDDQASDYAGNPLRPKFLGFGRSLKVDFLRGPVPDDEHNRFYWNIGGDSTAEGGLRAITNALDSPTPNGLPAGSGATYRPFRGYRVGVPAPAKAPRATNKTPELALDYGTISNVSRTSPMTVTTSAEVPFSDGDEVRITINPDLPNGDAQPPTEEGTVPDDNATGDSMVGRLWNLEGQRGRVANVGESGPGTFDIIGASGGALGNTSLTVEERRSIRIERVLSDQDMEARVYVFTYVTEFDEEGPPSPPSNVLTSVPRVGGRVELQLSDNTWTLSSQGGDRRYVNRFRIYRKVAGSQSGVYLYVGEGNFSETNMENRWSEVTFDEVSAVELGEPLASERWYPPPLGMEGVQLMPNGFMVGFKGNVLYFSEPYLPHAWNPDYKRTVDSDILGVQSYGNTLVIGTRGRPYLATGTDPASMSVRKLDTFAPLAKPRAMVDAGVGVLYPSTVGMMMINQGTVRNITESMYDKATWETDLYALDYGIFHDSRAIFFGPGKSPLIIDMNGDQVDLSRFRDTDSGVDDFSAACIAGSELAFVAKLNGEYRAIKYFKTGGEAMDGRWISGLITAPKATNMAVCQVFASEYPLLVALHHANLQGGQPDLDSMTRKAYIAEGPEPFRLPADYLSREYRIEVQGRFRVQSVTFASSMEELRRES